MMSKYIILFYGFFLYSSYSFAQTDLRTQYEEFKKQAKKSYEDFRDKANKQYSDFIRNAWKQYKTLPKIIRPKNEEIPPVIFDEEEYKKNRRKQKIQEEEQVFDEKGNDNKKIAIRHNGEEDEMIHDDEGRKCKIDSVITPPSPTPQPVPISPIHEVPQDDETVSFAFYGTTYQVRFSKKARFSIEEVSNNEIANIWDLLSSHIANNTIRDCLELRIKLQLSDWAYLNMLDKFSETVFGKGNEATLFTAYIYCQSGYKMRLAMADGRLCMLFASKHTIYDTGYFNIDGENFYPFNCNVNNLRICEAEFPEEKPLSLLLPSAQNFAYNGSNPRTLTSKRYPNVSVDVQVNKNLIDFYNTYPSSELGDNFMTRWAMYANTPMEEEVKQSLYPALKKCIMGLSEREAVERLLNWVQTAFTYEYDDKVWGQDRAFFAEESLYYPYCDCEDRSILFTRIVRDLLGLDCILIYYPGHLASAVCFNEQVGGDYISLGGKRYVVCDGTYIGAPVGMTMPDMDNKTAKVILLNKDK